MSTRQSEVHTIVRLFSSIAPPKRSRRARDASRMRHPPDRGASSWSRLRAASASGTSAYLLGVSGWPSGLSENMSSIRINQRKSNIGRIKYRWRRWSGSDHLRTDVCDETLPFMSDLPRFWTLKTRKPLHPAIPSRTREWFLFVAAALLLAVGPLYILSAYIRRLLTAYEAVQMCLPLWFGGGVFVVLGTLCRWWRLKKLRMHLRSKRNLAAGLSEPD